MPDYFIEFPKIGIRLEVSPVAFKIFGREIFFYGVMIACAFAVALILAFRNAKKHDIDSNVFSDLIIIATPVAIIFSRFFYVVFEWDSFRGNFWQIFNLRSGGLAIYGAVIGAAIAVFVYTIIMKKKQIKIMKYLDFVAPYFILAQGIGRFGNFFNQEAFGTNTSLPWGMTGNLIVQELTKLKSLGFDLDPARNVHPTFLYEFIWNMLVFSFLIYLSNRKKKDGQVVFAYMALYGFGRMFIEGLRTDSLMVIGLRANQLLAFAIFIVFGFLYYLTVKKPKEIIETPVEHSPFADLAKKIREEHKSGNKDSE